MIDTVSILGSLGTSDHIMLKWTVQLQPLMSVVDCPYYDYRNADYPRMRQALTAVNWSQILQGDANDQWISMIELWKIGIEQGPQTLPTSLAYPHAEFG